jgi:hypothetical protein
MAAELDGVLLTALAAGRRLLTLLLIRVVL